MIERESLIDFEPMRIGSLLLRDKTITIVFPQQPCFSRAVEAVDERRVPLYKCELQIHNGRVETNKVAMPFEADEWELSFHGGSRRCFLPIGLDVPGPIQMRIGKAAAPDIVIFGDRAVLLLDEVVGFETLKKC